jgi:hypothetical protein
MLFFVLSHIYAANIYIKKVNSKHKKKKMQLKRKYTATNIAQNET